MHKNYCKYILSNSPDAIAVILGSPAYPDIKAQTEFYQISNGVLIVTEAFNLPLQNGSPFGIFAYHIHSGKSCSGNSEDPFANSDGHFNPTNKPHPMHEGDLPPLFSNNGYAYSAVLTSRFYLDDIIGRTIIIHDNPDDFTTQPAGNAGTKIACGVIEKMKHFNNKFMFL